MAKYTRSKREDLFLMEGARIVLNTLYNLGYEFPDGSYSVFLEDVRRQLNEDVPYMLRGDLEILKDRRHR